MRRRIAYGMAAVAAVAVLAAGVAIATRDDGDEGSGTAAGEGTGGAAASTTTVAPAPTTVPAGEPAPGAPDVGDPYFPGLGNGGYDVEHYELDLAWVPDAGRLDGQVTIEATATQALSRFNLDLLGYDVTSLEVDAKAVEPVREGERELVVTPPAAIARGDAFTVEVAWTGVPQELPELSGILRPGWIVDDDGETHIIGEPNGASAIFPGNDHPTDKATYDLRVTVPAGTAVAANGVHTGRQLGPGGTEAWAFEVAEPMATYLLQVVTGNLRVTAGTGPEGLPLRNAVDEDVPEGILAPVGRIPDMIDLFDDSFGPYPFTTYGVVVVDEALGVALENQTLSLFGLDSLDEVVMAHELAHQWFGDDVGPGTWRDIWLNEGFATYAQWMWSEASGGPDIATLAGQAAGRGEQLNPPPADPGADNLFGLTVYLRGALTLHVLRDTMGDEAFFDLLRAWVERYGGRTATTADFESLAASMTTEDIAPLFEAWLHQPELPLLDEWVA
jgi:aminopeptidase N